MIRPLTQKICRLLEGSVLSGEDTNAFRVNPPAEADTGIRPFPDVFAVDTDDIREDIAFA